MSGSKLVISIVVLLIIFGAGYYFYSSRTNSSENASPQVTEEKNEPKTEKVTEGSNSAMVEDSVTVNLSAQNTSGQTGTATLKEQNGKTLVMIKLVGAPATAQPAHIHLGACPDPGAVKYPLQNVVNGESTTTLDVSLKEIKDLGDAAINVHKSAADIKTYVACGNLPK